jgi:hypothetical protein
MSPFVRSRIFPLAIAEDLGNQSGQHFCRAGADQRIEVAHANDRHREPPAKSATRIWSTSKKRIMLEGMRADFLKVDRLSVKVMENGQQSQAGPRDPRLQAPTWFADLKPALPLGENERHHQHREVGKFARRRSVHHARRSQWHICD